ASQLVGAMVISPAMNRRYSTLKEWSATTHRANASWSRDPSATACTNGCRRIRGHSGEECASIKRAALTGHSWAGLNGNITIDRRVTGFAAQHPIPRLLPG